MDNNKSYNQHYDYPTDDEDRKTNTQQWIALKKSVEG